MEEAEAPSLWSVSVRQLVEFVLRKGNLGGEGRFSGPARALEGTRGHQRLQNDRPEGYEREVTVKLDLNGRNCRLRIQGRIDGVMRSADGVLIEEIKTVAGWWNSEADPLHWAQGKIYAHLLLQGHPEHRAAEVQLTYLELGSGEVTEVREKMGREELAVFFDEVAGVYLRWVEEQEVWRELRDQSIAALGFPFERYRPGQRRMAVAVYRSLVRTEKLFVEAPTGIGKTVSACFPAVKALGKGVVDKVFYLTAKTVGRGNAEAALKELRRSGLRLRSVTLTAKDKICFNGGRRCDVAACPYAIGYYDRARQAVEECLKEESLTRAVLETVALRHQVCPFELSLDAAVWSELIIGDYNHVFDPKAQLKRFFSDRTGRYGLLVDEAHNLVDRAREMFSASLTKAGLLAVRRALQHHLPACAKVLGRAQRALLALKTRGRPEGVESSKAAPEALISLLRLFLQEAEAWLGRDQPAEFRDELLEFYFQVGSFVRTSELYNERYTTIVSWDPRDVRVRLFCLDPSEFMQATLEGRPGIFFSATLSPSDYYRDLLGAGEEDPFLQLGSPFPPEHLGVMAGLHVGTTFNERGTTVGAVAEAIATLVGGRRGNYLVYFPSYAYLETVLARFREMRPELKIMHQRPGLSEEERAEFLQAFQTEHSETLVGFAIMGGVFGEGIDLVGERLVGAVVVGVGLPQLCLERDLIRDHFEERNGRGFDYAYAFPGINRVLQAAGRVIRSEQDRGVVLLVDRRFGEGRYWRMLPRWWRPERLSSASAIGGSVRGFWERATGSRSPAPTSASR